ncbi:hypothetical protein PGT21_029278 [Puccinia graminis f. sp. tritici]|uniref:Uncharacterized protein n=1 Tax=Puccinia graminis f. sp. tritici TaxID=56615 RepID=A0A5B0QYB2_PUCGR|nr:hypothetical protein PGT21_029278 [Puccinia graminis f. sp. tritici]KAA1112217.1 hypothetical protein PGTUg99_015157 [Puccinia graminis f. sp. tritici]KAA1118307.1 hypothetical protein PGTUg99_003407 [Puccinia graminis f. sp. tritici]
MPRPPKKKAKKNAENKDDFRSKSGKASDLEAESSDEMKNLASIVKLKRSSKTGNHSFEIFERKCSQLIENTTKEIELKIKTHEENLARIYESVEEINEEVEPGENEAVFERKLNKNFDAEINSLSRALTDMNTQKSCDRDELQVDSELLEELNLRPERLAEFSQLMTSECKRGFRMYCENNLLVSDARKFKERYKALMKEALWAK